MSLKHNTTKVNEGHKNLELKSYEVNSNAWVVLSYRSRRKAVVAYVSCGVL